MNFSLLKLLIFMTVMAVTVWFLRELYVGYKRVEIGENVASVKWLPKSATNVSFYKSYHFTAYEFDISESEFARWSRWPVIPTNLEVTMVTYRYRLPGPREPTADATKEQIDRYTEYLSRLQHKFCDGLYYKELHDNGAVLEVGYDRAIGRAYFHLTPR